MKQTLVTFIHQPKKVALVSLILALAIGVFGYMRIHKAPTYQFAPAVSGTITGTKSGMNNLSLGFLAGGRIKSVLVKTGDTVKTGQVLATLDAGNAAGALTQAKAAYSTAQANYQKVLNGATGVTIDVAKAAVNTAKINLDQVVKQQGVLVENARKTFLNSSLQATAQNVSSDDTAPTISGTYTDTKEGEIALSIYATGNGAYFSASGLVVDTGKSVSTTPQPIGNSGLFISFPSTPHTTDWVINIPNKRASNYLSNYNAYQSALQTQSQTIAQAQAVLDQAQASLTALVTQARPEDVQAAQAQVDNAYGALQIAQATYNNTVITALGDGTVTSVSITPGQIALPNTPAIELLASVANKTVAVMIPKDALVMRNGNYYVDKKNTTGITETQVTVGVSDAQNIEIVSGLLVGDQVVVH